MHQVLSAVQSNTTHVSSSITQVNKEFSEVNIMSDDILNHIGKTATVSAHQYKQVQKIKETADDLAKSSAQLQELVHDFEK